MKHIFALIIIFSAFTVLAKDEPITRDNINQLELGYAIPGECGKFSPDGSMLIINDQEPGIYHIYDIATGEKIHEAVWRYGGTYGFNNDATLMYVMPDRCEGTVYDTATGEGVFMFHGFPKVFTDNNKYLSTRDNTCGEAGLYSVETGERLYGEGHFSADQSVYVTSDGVYDLTDSNLHRVVAGGDSVISPSEKLLIVAQDGIFEMESGVKLAPFVGRWDWFWTPKFSNDETLVMTATTNNVDGFKMDITVYDMATGEALLYLGGINRSNRIAFNPDNTLLAIEDFGVYKIATGERLFSILSEYFVRDLIFSPDSRELVIEPYICDVTTGACTDVDGVLSPDETVFATNECVMDMQTWTCRFLVNNNRYRFSDDSTRLVVNFDGVYDVSTGEQLFPITGEVYLYSEDGKHVTIKDGGEYTIYNLENGQILNTTSGLTPRYWNSGQRSSTVFDYSPVFNSDETLYMTRNAIHDAETGEVVFDYFGTYPAIVKNRCLIDESGDTSTCRSVTYYTSPEFSPDNTILRGCARIAEGQYVNMLYGLEGREWPYRSGHIFAPREINVRELPSTDSRIVTTVEGAMAVFARTADNAWYRIKGDGYTYWVSSSVVRTISMPSDVPIEYP